VSRDHKPAILYALAAFGAGFVPGPIREFLPMPAIGRLWALLAELPLMMAFCWRIAPRVIRRCNVPARRGQVAQGVRRARAAASASAAMRAKALRAVS
jgi:ABC-type uncharacterized transport system permease subunit